MYKPVKTLYLYGFLAIAATPALANCKPFEETGNVAKYNQRIVKALGPKLDAARALHRLRRPADCDERQRRMLIKLERAKTNTWNAETNTKSSGFKVLRQHCLETFGLICLGENTK